MWGAEESFDFSSGTYSGSGNTGQISWLGTSCTILQTKGDNTSNNVNSTYNGTNLRWYQYHYVRFTPAANVTITKVVLVGTSSQKGQTMTKTSNSADASITTTSATYTTEVTGTWTSSSFLELKMGSQFRLGSVTIIYTKASSKTDLTLDLSYSPNPIILGENASSSPTLTGNAGNGTVTYSLENVSPAGCMTINESTGAISPVAVGTAKAVASVAETTNYNSGTKKCDVSVVKKYTVTLGDDTEHPISEETVGGGVTLPSRDGCTGYKFEGWSTTYNANWTTTAPTIIKAGSYSPTSDITLYPVYTKEEEGGALQTVTIFEETCSSRPTSTTSITNSDSNWDAIGGNLTGVSISGSARTYNSGLTNPPCFGFTSTNYKDLTISGINTSGYSNLTLSYLIKGNQSGGTYATYTVSTNAVSNNSVELTTSGTATTCSTANTLSSLSIPATSSLTLTFTAGSNITNRAFYVDDIKITGQTGGSTTNYISVPTCCTPLAALKGSVSRTNPTTSVLSWDAIDHVSSWTVKYRTHGDGDWTTFNGDIATANNRKSATITTTCGTKYDFEIIATPANGYCAVDTILNNNGDGFDAGKYAISLDPANGEVTGGSFAASESACNGDNVDLLAEAATGYAFNGWTITKASSGTISPAANIAETIFEMPAEAVTVSAAFSLVNYTITYENMDGATNHANNPATYTINSADITLGDPTKEGFDFGGWFTDGDLAPEHAVSTPAIAAGSHENKTFYAKWTQAGTHLVTISDYSNGSVSVTYTGMESALTSGTRNIAENTVLTITATPNDGYDGLLTVGGEDFTSGNTYTLAADITIEALFEPQTYTISYKDEGGANYSGSNLGSLPTSHTYNAATALVNGVKAGHSFGGWFTDEDCTESAGTSIAANSITADITLYAKWEELTMYTVTWKMNGATYTAGTPSTSVEDGSKVTTLPTAPTVCDDDLTFMGWTNAPIEGTQVTAPAVLFTTEGAAPAVTGNVTYHAVFAAANQLTATFNAADISNLTENYTNNWTHTATGITFSITAGQRYTKNEPNTFTVTKNSSCGLTSPDGVKIKKVILTVSEDNSTTYIADHVTPGSLATSGTTQTITSVNDEYLYIYATASNQIRITNLEVKYTPASPTYSNYRTLYDASVPTPTLDVASGKYTSDQLVTISNYDGNYMYFYTTNGSTPAADANLDPISPAVAYNSNDGIEITETSTVKVIAYDLCHNASEVTTATYTIAESLTLAEFVEQKPTTNEKVDLTGAIVMARDDEYGYIYVQKDEAAMALYYGDDVPNWTVGKQIANGIITGHYDVDYLEMEVTDAGSPTATEDGVLPTPLLITDDNAATLMVEANMYRYAQMNSVTLDYDNNSYLNAYSTTSDKTYYYEDQFSVLGTLPLSTTECSVKGIITPYTKNEAYHFDQLSPIRTNDISTNATAVLPTISDLGGADAAHAVEVAEGKEITITEKADFDAIYQINDGAETAINTSAVVTITNTAAATKLYVKASRDYYADNSVTYYYIANSALTEHAITCATGLAGGSISADKSAAVNGAIVTLTPSPAEHFHWVSWTVTYNDGESKTIDVVNNQFTMPGYDVNVSATFAEDAFATVSYAKGDEAATGDVPANQKIYVGNNVTLPANPFTFAGHNFAGWKYNDVTKQPSETYEVTATGTITFTAQWTANPICTVTLHAKGAEDIVEEVVQGAIYNIPDAGALSGYTFSGWADATHNDETTEAIDVVSSFTPEVQAEASTKDFYAVYTRIEGKNQYVKVTSDLGTAWAGDYLIACHPTIFANGQKGGKDDNGSIGKADVKVDLSESIVNNTIAAKDGNPCKVTLEEISANSNTYLLKTQDGKYNYQTTYDNGLVASSNKATASLYPITVTFTSEDDVELVLGGNAAGVAFKYNASYRIFRYYKTGQSPIYLYKYVEGTTYYTTNPTVKYNVSYELGEGAWRTSEGCEDVAVEAGTVYDEVCEYEPVLATKVFDKWQVNDADIELPYTINANTTFTAVYRDAVSYAVNYDANGGVGSAPAATNVQEAADYTVLANAWFFRSGYSFQGWNTVADGSGVAYAADAVMAMPSANVTLYAQWQVMPANEKEVVIVDKVGNNYYAMGQTLNNSDQFNAIAVAGVRDNKVILPDGFSDENKTAITWHMITNDNGATASFYSPANNKYLAGGSNLSLSNDPVVWTWSSENQCYVIGGRTFMYRNTYNFKSYSTQNIGATGYAEAMYVTTAFAKAITEDDATEAELTLGDNIVVKDGATLTIGGERFINDVVVENGGNLTLNANLSIHDLIIHSTLGKGTGTGAGTGNNPGNCGQIANGNNITVNGDVYLELELTQDNAASAGWYAFSVPFPVDALNGVYFGDTKLTNEVGYAIMSYHGDIRAQGQYAWKKYRDIMQPGVLYIITVGDTDYKTLRFKKHGNEAFNVDPNVGVKSYPVEPGIDATNKGWNGIGNPNMQISYLPETNNVVYMQFLIHEENRFQVRQRANVNIVVGSAFFVQYSGNSDATIEITPGLQDGANGYLAPKRERNAVEETIYEVQLTNLATEEVEDNIYLTAREEATGTYEVGRDLAKMSMGNAKCAQMYVPAYGTQLCAADFPLVNDEAAYPLTFTAPANGQYRIEMADQDNADLYLTLNGAIIWNLSMGAYEFDLTQGTTEGYGLLLKAKAPNTATGIDDIDAEAGVQKLVIDDKIFILRNGRMYDVTGKMAK